MGEVGRALLATACLAGATAMIVACAGAAPPADDGDEIALPSRQAATDDGGAAPAPAPPPAPPAPTCNDGVENGDETDIDCGGTCHACALGRTCKLASDCSTNDCTSGTCCAKTSATLSTGSVSGSKQICCPAGATLTAVKDCGHGHNHSATAVSATCALAREGSGNDGDACAQITCAVETCSADAGAPDAH